MLLTASKKFNGLFGLNLLFIFADVRNILDNKSSQIIH